MRKLPAFVLALLLIGAGTAAAQDVRYNYDNKANFSAFKTYRWVVMKQEQPVNDLVAQQIRAAWMLSWRRRGCRGTSRMRRISTSAIKLLWAPKRSSRRTTAGGVTALGGTGAGGTGVAEA